MRAAAPATTGGGPDWRPWIEIDRNGHQDTATAKLLTELGKPRAGKVAAA